jgi:hypothetical protein
MEAPLMTCWRAWVSVIGVTTKVLQDLLSDTRQVLERFDLDVDGVAGPEIETLELAGADPAAVDHDPILAGREIAIASMRPFKLSPTMP